MESTFKRLVYEWEDNSTLNTIDGETGAFLSNFRRRSNNEHFLCLDGLKNYELGFFRRVQGLKIQMPVFSYKVKKPIPKYPEQSVIEEFIANEGDTIKTPSLRVEHRTDTPILLIVEQGGEKARKSFVTNDWYSITGDHVDWNYVPQKKIEEFDALLTGEYKDQDVVKEAYMIGFNGCRFWVSKDLVKEGFAKLIEAPDGIEMVDIIDPPPAKKRKLDTGSSQPSGEHEEEEEEREEVDDGVVAVEEPTQPQVQGSCTHPTHVQDQEVCQ